MSQQLRHARVRKTYEFIKSHQRQFPVAVQCRVLQVAPSGYYAWLKKPVSDRGLEDARLLRLIRASYTASQGIYGAPRVFLDLREAGRGLQQAPRRASHAGVRLAGVARLSHTTLDCEEARSAHPEPPDTSPRRC